MFGPLVGAAIEVSSKALIGVGTAIASIGTTYVVSKRYEKKGYDRGLDDGRKERQEEIDRLMAAMRAKASDGEDNKGNNNGNNNGKK